MQYTKLIGSRNVRLRRNVGVAGLDSAIWVGADLRLARKAAISLESKIGWRSRFVLEAAIMIGMAKRLDHKLDCKSCGTIKLSIPPDATDDTPISCSRCGADLGTWGDLQDDLHDQLRGTSGAFDLHDGQFDEKRAPIFKRFNRS